MKTGRLLVFCLILMPFLHSCINTREAIYFNVKKDAVTQIQQQAAEMPIQKNDLLSIIVSSKSEEASRPFNVTNTGTLSNTSNNVINAAIGGYLVNEQGNIQFPAIGTIKAEGLTRMRLQDTITRMLDERKLLLEPIVSVRNLNFKITVLGEVARPTVVNVPSEKINMLEALGFAGDLTIYANRKNVLLIREENNQRIFKVVNLNSNEIFSSNYFYLKPNDIIYVEPNKTKISSASALRQWLPVIFSAISLATITLYRIR